MTASGRRRPLVSKSIQMALEGYVIALEDCDLVDPEKAVTDCIKGAPHDTRGHHRLRI